MRIQSLAAGTALGALTMSGALLSLSASAAEYIKSVGAANPDTVAHFSVYLPLTNTAALDKLAAEQTDQTSANYHHWLTPAQFKQQFGPDRSVVAKATAALHAAGFTVLKENTQNLEVEGPVWAIEKTFSAHLEKIQDEKGNVVLGAAERHLKLPASLSSLGAIIPEFTPQLHAHVHSARKKLDLGHNPLVRLSSESLYYPNDLNEAYLLPSFISTTTPKSGGAPVQMAGVGSHIGIVISSVISNADLGDTFNSTFNSSEGPVTQAYSANSNLPVPTVAVRKVNGGSGPFNVNDDAAFEASLDTQMSLGTAPGATETIYDMPNLYDFSILAAYQALDDDNIVDVVSSSFGECELYYTAAYNGGTDLTYILTAYHRLFQQGNVQGITFMASSGDNGAVPCVVPSFFTNPTNGTNFVKGVESPAVDPNVTAVGGTNLQTSATPGADDATYLGENANYDPRVPSTFTVGGVNYTVNNNTWGSGGGFSAVYAQPGYQQLVNTGNTAHRAVPDVSLMMGGCPGDADLSVQDCTMLPRSAAIIWVGGTPEGVIGTSSSSPEMAAVIALAVEANGGRLGNVNPLIYLLAKQQTNAGGKNAPAILQYFHEDVSGDNNGYTVAPNQGFSEVLGNGTLNVKTFLRLRGLAAAGTPNTPSNP